MSFAKTTFVLALAGMLLASPAAFAQVGGGNDLPSDAKTGTSNPGMSKGGMMKSGGMMKKHKKMMKKHKHM